MNSRRNRWLLAVCSSVLLTACGGSEATTPDPSKPINTPIDPATIGGERLSGPQQTAKLRGEEDPVGNVDAAGQSPLKPQVLGLCGGTFSLRGDNEILGARWTVDTWVQLEHSGDQTIIDAGPLSVAVKRGALVLAYRGGEERGDSINAHEWYHLSLVYDNGVSWLFVDGRRVAALDYQAQQTKLSFGDASFCGWLDNVRVVQDVVRTADFLPEAKLTMVDNTVAAFNFDGARGDVINDLTGLGHEGTIVGKGGLQQGSL